MSKITNTATKEVNVQWLSGGDPNAIEAQEAEGQRQLVNSTQLPTKVSEKGKSKLEEAGVRFDVPCEGDPLFCNVKLPDGWGFRATKHSMHSELLDSEGRVAARIFYKAAFYDRKASMSVEE